MSNAALTAAAAASAHGQHVPSVINTNIGLARTFAALIRQTTDLLAVLDESANARYLVPGLLKVPAEVLSTEVQQNLYDSVDALFKPTWDWLMTVLDSTESQLRFGCSLNKRLSGGQGHKASSSSGSSSSLRSGDTETKRRQKLDSTARRDFLSYALSLLRAQSSEHLDSLPVIDVASLKHIA